MLTTLEAINARRSIPRLSHPGPSGAELSLMFRAAASAPDHGRCRPWRFIVVSQQCADDFGKVLEEAYVRRCTESGEPVDPQRCARERARLRRAPTLIVVACQPRSDTKIPLHEQYAAVAAATQNLLLSATAMGYGSNWVTGAAATDPFVKEALGLDAEDSIMGFIYLGTVPIDSADRGRGGGVDTSGVVRTWFPVARSNGFAGQSTLLAKGNG